MSRENEPDATAGQIRGSTLLLAGRGLSVGMNFLTQVVTVRYLVKEDYGSLAYALAMVSFFGKISRFGMDKAVSRIAAIQDEHREYGRMFGTLLFALGLVVLCGSTIAFGVIGLGDTWGPSFVTDPLSLHLLLILIALAPVNALDNMMQSVFAIFSKPQLIFFRKYVVGPSLKLLAVLWVMLTAGDARSLAIAHLFAGLLGLTIGLSLAGTVLKERDLLQHFRWRDVRVQVREILGYGLPMLGSDAVLLLRGALVVFLLEFAHGSASVADFRAVLPVARLNHVALETFAYLFIPAVARLTAVSDPRSLNEMYWRSTTWVTILSLPIFLVTFCLARPVTVLLFSERYAGAAIVLAVLSAGYFLDATLAMSGHALKAAGHVREVLMVDGAALVLGLVLTFVLVPLYGALGGALAATFASVAHGLTYQIVLGRTMQIRMLPTGFGRIYGALGLVALVVLLLDILVSPPLLIQVPLVSVAWLAVLVRVAPQLQLKRTFPELLRLPVLGGLIERALTSDAGTAESSATVNEIRDTLEHAAGRLTADVGGRPHGIHVLRTHQRAGSLILECDVTGSGGRLPVLVKAVDVDETQDARGLNTGMDRPRLGRREHAAATLATEKATLRAIHDHLRELGDPRFEPVRVLDVFPNGGSIAMERLPHPTLHALIHRQSLRPWAAPSPLLLTASANAGAWLRAFHQMSALDHTERRHATRSDFVSQVRRMTSFIADAGEDPVFLERLVRGVTAASERFLPEDLPCGLSHGDYAPRNILVGPGGQVAVIDTTGRSLSAVYLDLGYFLANTWTSMTCVLTRGVLPPGKILDAVERELLKGYFGGAPPRPNAVRLYAILSLLARSAASIQGRDRRSIWRHPARHSVYRARTGHIGRHLRRLLASIEEDRPVAAA